MFDYLSFLFLSLLIFSHGWADQVKLYSSLIPLLSLLVAIVIGGFTVANVIHHW